MTDKYLDFINAHSGLKTEIYNVLDGHCNRKRNLMYPGNGMDLTGHFLDLTTEEKEIINSIKDSNK
ncbi:MAG: hypothetical protein KDD14_24625, partial [Saprospiraceae bacterium]|nr:hypothetical protein [Saprospiraceae bacterium]